MNPTQLFIFAIGILVTYAQVCPPTEVLFLLDQSENARLASSDDPSNDLTKFNILQNSISSFYNNDVITSSINPIRVGVYDYSSSFFNITPAGSSLNDARATVNQIGKDANAGSWTYIGLEGIRTRPLYANNKLIIISSQGSGSASRRTLAQSEILRVRQLGWNPYVIALQGRNPVDFEELTMINGGVRPPYLNDTVNSDPKSYRLLTPELNKIIANLCNELPPTTTPTTTTTTTTPTTTTTTPTTTTTTPTTTTTTTTTTTPTTTTTTTPTTTTRSTTTTTLADKIFTFGGSPICSKCLFEGGFGFDSDPQYCDTFYQCIPDSEPIKKLCPAGTFWNGDQCDFIHKVKCQLAVCDIRTPAGTRYPSGRCCNKFYECNNGNLTEMSCPMDQFYDATSSRCQTVSNRTVVCEMTNRFECDVNRNGPVKTEACAGYAPDPYGNPCKYQYQGISLSVAPGTEWNQTKCSLDFSKTDRCYNTLVALDRDFLGNGSSNVCNAVFLANFDNGSKTVLSERLNKALDVYSIQQEVRLENNALTFTPDMSNAFLYYFFFNNKDMASNTAFRARVRLDNPQLNREYDIFSNSYCSQCPDTIRLTVSATSSTKRVVTAMFVTTGNSSVQTSAIIDLRNANDMMDITVVFGDNAIYGKVKEVSGSNVNSVIQAVDFSRVGKTAGSHIAINKCGIQLGRGPNNHFVGLIDQFAVYESCQDIDSVLR